MFCKNCGSKLNEGVKFCQNCGSAVEKVEEVKVENSSPVESIPQVNNVPVPPVNMTPQPPMNGSGMVPQQPSGGKKKNDILLFIVIGIIGVALILVPIILVMGKDKETPSTNTNSNSGVSTNTNTNSHSNTHSNSNSHSNHVFTNRNTNSNSGINTNTNTNTNTNSNTNSNQGMKEVTLSGYTFQIPKQVVAEMDGDDLFLTNLRTKDDEAFLGIAVDNYEKYKNSKELVKQQMQSTGLTVGDIFVSTYGGVEFVVIPMSRGNIHMVYGMAKLSDQELAMVMVANTATYQLDYSLLNEMGSILATAKKANQL